jgi:hypothetical protein
MEIVMTPITLVSATPSATAFSGCKLPYPCRSFAVEVSWATAGAGADKAITALILAFEGSISGTTYEALDTATTLSAPQLTAKYAMFRVIDKPCSYVRINATTATVTGSTGTITLTVKLLPLR